MAPELVIEELSREERGAALDEWLAVRNAVDIDPLTREGFALRLASELAGLRLLARRGVDAVGAGTANWDSMVADDGEAFIRIWVLPQYRRKGIGAAMYERLLAFATSHDRVTVVTRVLRDDGPSLAFAERRGLVTYGMQQVAHYDLAPSDATARHAPPEGIAICSIAERPDLDHAVYDLQAPILAEVPSLRDAPVMAYDAWRETLKGPVCLPDLCLMAVDGDRVVGWIETLDEGQGQLFILMLAVAPDARRRGIARALKVALAQRAAAAGWRVIESLNDGTNEGVRQLNESLGYRYMPATLLLRGHVPGA